MTDADEFRRAGLYDPAMPDAGERLALLGLLRERGVTVDEMVEALAAGRLVGLAVDTVVRPQGERITLDQLCGRAGLDADLCVTLLRAVGLAVPDADDAAFSDADVEAFRFLGAIALLSDVDTVLQIGRAAGAAMATLAEAELAAVRTSFEGPMRAAGVSDFGQAQSLMTVAGMLPEILKVLDVLHRRHLLAGMRTDVMWDEAGRPRIDMAVGFADLVGYTTTAQALDAHDLRAMISRFETTAGAVITDGNGRLVKVIGDEVMFRAPAAGDACAIALSLLRIFSADPVLPELRIGLCAGPVLPFEGDYYGPTVNVAARLAKEAGPATALACAELVRRAGSDAGCAFEPRGHLALKGVGDVEVVRLVDS
jgi:adenylate cyclase